MSRIPSSSALTLLPDLAPEIATLIGRPCPKSYAQLLRMVNDGTLPAMKSGGRYSVDARTAIEILGLKAAA